MVRASYISSPAGGEAAAGLQRPVRPQHHGIRHHEPPVGCPWALGGGQARPIYRGLSSGLCSSCRLPPSACAAGITGPGHTLSSRTMAALHTLRMGLVLLGVLGVLQTGAQPQVSLQPNFQQDKVRGSPAQGPVAGGRRSLGPSCLPGKGAEQQKEADQKGPSPPACGRPPTQRAEPRLPGGQGSTRVRERAHATCGHARPRHPCASPSPPSSRRPREQAHVPHLGPGSRGASVRRGRPSGRGGEGRGGGGGGLPGSPRPTPRRQPGPPARVLADPGGSVRRSSWGAGTPRASPPTRAGSGRRRARCPCACPWWPRLQTEASTSPPPSSGGAAGRALPAPGPRSRDSPWPDP